MKKLLIVLLLAECFSAMAQKKISYDFITKKFDYSFKKGFISIPHKGFIDLYLYRADTAKYDIEVNKKAVTYTYPQEEKEKEAKVDTLTSQVVLYYRINNIESDELIVTITAKNKKSKQSLPDISFTIRTYGQWKLNISTGAIFNIGLSDKNYEIQNNTIVDSGNENDLVPLFPTVLTHAYKKSSGNFNWGAAFGFGVSDGENVSFYAGPSLLFGEAQRLVFSGGVGLRKVKQLKKQYEVGQSFSDNTPDASELISDPYKLGGFFAITYNLSSKTD